MMKRMIERLRDCAIYIFVAIGFILFCIYALNLAITMLLAPIACVYDLFKALGEFISVFF